MRRHSDTRYMEGSVSSKAFGMLLRHIRLKGFKWQRFTEVVALELFAADALQKL